MPDAAAPAQANRMDLGHRSRGPTLFISDLHLTPERPEPLDLFRRFLRDVAPQAGELYILGDFFESWVGDDDVELPFHAEVAGQLKDVSEQGTRIYFMAGNRDFLAGDALARATGWTPLADPTVMDLHGIPTLLSHGDAYCTEDRAYQAFRQQVRDPQWQALFLAKPVSERREQARMIRMQSRQAKADKAPDIMDVNPEAIRTAMANAGVTRMIHGHTHRPARHLLQIAGQECERWVLPDWYDTGGYLSCDSRGCHAVSIA